MKLDVSCMRYLSKDDFRVLVAVEMGMRNHELVPIELITNIAKLRHGGIHKILSTLLRYKLLAHANAQYNGYRLSYMGFDILALKALLSRGVIASVGSQIGVGKESDIFEAQDPEGNELVLKIHRLGRTSFRAVRRHRDYMTGKSKASWLYMSRLAAIKEFAFMKALYAHGFPTPIPVDQSRHIVAMSRINGFPMSQIKAGKLPWAEDVYLVCIALLKRLAEHGLVHCDFNEFNLMIDNDCKVTLIDFPQMVSTSHPNASELFQRDVNGLVKFFAMKMRYIPPEELVVKLDDIVQSETRIDDEVRASGFSEKEDQELIGFITESRLAEDELAAGGGSGGEEGDDADDYDDDSETNDVGDDEEIDGAEAPALVTAAARGVSATATGLSVFDFAGKSSAVGDASGPKDDDDDEDIEDVLKAGERAGRAGVAAGVEGGGEGEGGEGSDLSDSDDEEVVGELTEEAIKQAKEKARSDFQRRQGGRGGGMKPTKRNMTKKRNKYGKIDRVEKIDTSGW